MPNNINELLKNKDLEKLNSKLKEMKTLLILALLGEELSGLKDLMGDTDFSSADDIKNPNPMDIKTSGETEAPIKSSDGDIIEELENIATSKVVDDEKVFLLHRPTENFEYSGSIKDNDLEYETDEDTVWYAEVMTGEINQQGQNPVVSCWIPKEKIIGSPTPHENTGTWGDLGKNPFADIFSVTVEPGKYKIYQELKQRR